MGRVRDSGVQPVVGRLTSPAAPSWIFGTYYMPVGRLPENFGIPEDFPKDFLGQLGRPFAQCVANRPVEEPAPTPPACPRVPASANDS